MCKGCFLIRNHPLHKQSDTLGRRPNVTYAMMKTGTLHGPRIRAATRQPPKGHPSTGKPHMEALHHSGEPHAVALASYVGFTPWTRQSGNSIRSETVSHHVNKRLKRELFLSAFASLRSDEISRAQYARKRANGKRHNQAVIALAHRRPIVIYAMMRDGTNYSPQPSRQVAKSD